MKEIQIRIGVDEVSNQIVTLQKVTGYNKESINDNFEILGILQNLCFLQNEKMKVLGRKNLKE